MEPKYFKHEHNGTDSPRLPSKSILGVPADAITAGIGGSLTNGGAAVLSTADYLILVNMQTRIDNLEARLQSLGLIQ